ncbi:RNA-splicing ligase RtcB [Xanthomonas bromi]|nr:RNA-splicing ligase RtcB [Xanthomonas bromi]
MDVPAESQGLVFVDGKLVTPFGPGAYAFWNFQKNIVTDVVDLRVQSVEVSGQELLTRDKVSLRVNLAASMRVTDAVAMRTRVAKAGDYLYRELHYGLRRAVSAKTLDALLGDKASLDAAIFGYVRGSVSGFGIEVLGVGVKDVILPGGMRDAVVQAEKHAHAQLHDIAAVPFVGPWVTVMPDVHLGKGATVGSVIPTRGAIIPAAVGVDIGYGMAAVRTMLRANDLPDNLAQLRSSIERSVPVGNGRGGEHRTLPDSTETRIAQSGLVQRLDAIKQQHKRIRIDKLECQIGTLGGGNHFIEICLDETDAVWVMLHRGLRGTGNLFGTYFIERAREQLAHRVLGFHLPDKDLVFFMQGEPLFDEHVAAVSWAQDSARENREAMLARVLAEMRHRLPKFQSGRLAVDCHHNYVQKEAHGGEELLITRQGAVSARTAELGIIPGSMGTRSYIVRGLGNADSFHSCSHGAERVMSRTAARAKITLAQHREATAHVECRKDAAVADASPAAYKSIEAVMAAQQDLVEVLHTLRQVVCIKG